MRALILLPVAALLSGCLLGPQHSVPASELPELLTLPETVERDGADWQAWWRAFNDPALNRLIERAMADNLELREQAARIRAARARLGFAEADQLPSVDLQAEASRQQQPGAAFGIPGASSSTRSLFSVSGVLGYELDLWGRLAREREAAAAQLAENVFAREAVRLSLIADLVTTYFEYRSAQRQLGITQDAVATREESLGLQQLRYDAGAVNRLVLLQAKSELATARSRLPDQRERLDQLESALAILVGASPRELFEGMTLEDRRLADIEVLNRYPEVLPSELLERRPDIRAAEAALRAANAGIGAAQAARLPSLNLSGLIGSTAADSGDLFTGAAEAWSIGASVLGPVLDFGRGGANVEEAEALRDQAALQYQSTVQTAFREVRDALFSFEAAHDRVHALREQVAAITETAELAEMRYEAGATDLLTVLDARRALLDAELALSEALQRRLTASATLFKTLGGGWNPEAAAGLAGQKEGEGGRN
ncbi:efflux transporter outer membrane subunit [Algiphilus aromaticivorans]|uniref:efflux transporter outer membrane subunit n=1 Tax=Algiphilus aromaticivorans TaxID=382454 RepID=UPI0005C1F8E8|nr:efflux transporter outer membrane subunit [Algiphilus aromaticivorans]